MKLRALTAVGGALRQHVVIASLVAVPHSGLAIRQRQAVKIFKLLQP